ncbi:MAG: low molecular weight phosphotyrosine protein phosphatase [Rhodospirillales bacterium]|nr:low molecular weight phosphotyrosine protein phosphatase [Rhodospirillales bacterium]
MVNVLFVCLGNICRSPTAEGVFRTLVEREGLADKINVDSAGTGSWHVGEAPDRRATAAARKRGVDLSEQRARKVQISDFQNFDYVLAMDADNYASLSGSCPPGKEDRLRLFLDFAPNAGRNDVPDPYYGGGGGFDLVLDLVEEASQGLLADIREHHF